MSNRKTLTRRLTAYVLSLALALSCLHFSSPQKAEAASNTISLEYSTWEYWEITAAACELINSGSFEIAVTVEDATSSGWLYVELNEYDSAGNVSTIWSVDNYKMTSDGTYTITEEYTYFNKKNSSWTVLSQGAYEGAATWGKVKAGGCTVTGITVKATGSSGEEREKVDYDTKSSIYVDQLEGLDDDFALGMDVSSYISQKEAGVKYYDFEGNELDDAGFFEFLKECGTNWIRIRVWNDPYDSDGNGYGGGNNDLDKAITLGKLATDAGLKVLVNFHYSDFWADPGKQKVPKAWADYTLDEKAVAIGEYTTESLNKLADEGVSIDMVQIGNETTNGFCGETSWTNMCTLFNAGCAAVREFDSDILIAIHLTNIHKASLFYDRASYLYNNNVDYDILATSYYPYWHGSVENMTTVLSSIAKTYGKKVMVAEVAYIYTASDGDGHGNNCSSSYGYDLSPQGQADCIAAVTQGLLNVNKNVPDAAFGVFYWEPAWIPVNYYSSKDTGMWNVNKNLWEEYGCGWATRYASGYDGDAKSTGGSTVDNSSLFDFFGFPMDSLCTYKYLKSGCRDELAIESIDIAYVNFERGKYINMPDTVGVVFNDGTTGELEVTWDADDLRFATYDTAAEYRYTVKGTVTYNGYTRFTKAMLLRWSATVTEEPDDEHHIWGNDEYGTAPVFNWADDYSTCTATLTCIYDATHTEEVECTVTSEVTAESDFVNAGEITYTACCEVDGETYTDTKTEVIPALEACRLYTQKTDVEDGKYSRRWIMMVSLEDAESYEGPVFTITNETDNTWGDNRDGVRVRKCGEYYTSISAAGDSLEPAEDYVFLVYAIKNIPEGVELTGSLELE